MKGKLVLTSAEAEANHDKWLEVRRFGIGGSDAAVIVGMNPWKSAYALWAEKTGQVAEQDLSDNERVHFGTVLEQVVADEFCLRTGKKVRKCGTLQDEEYPFLLANIDRDVVGENAILECKTANGFAADEWKDDDVPTHYYLQTQFYMMVTGAEKCYIACLIGGNHFVFKEIPRNDDDIKALREAAVKFWTENVQGGVAPEMDGSDSTAEAVKNLHPTDNGDEIALPSIAKSLIEQWDQIKQAEAEIKKQKDFVQVQLQNLLGDNKAGCIEDRKVTWSNQAGRTTIDSKLLQKQWPDVYAAVAKVGKPSRRFSVK